MRLTPSSNRAAAAFVCSEASGSAACPTAPNESDIATVAARAKVRIVRQKWSKLWVCEEDVGFGELRTGGVGDGGRVLAPALVTGAGAGVGVAAADGALA